MPAFLTALDIALIAVHIAFRRVVSSPVAFTFLPSSNKNLVKVIALVSKAARSDMINEGIKRHPKRTENNKQEKLQLLFFCYIYNTELTRKKGVWLNMTNQKCRNTKGAWICTRGRGFELHIYNAVLSKFP